jgi:hypothetical protein
MVRAMVAQYNVVVAKARDGCRGMRKDNGAGAGDRDVVKVSNVAVVEDDTARKFVGSLGGLPGRFSRGLTCFLLSGSFVSVLMAVLITSLGGLRSLCADIRLRNSSMGFTPLTASESGVHNPMDIGRLFRRSIGLGATLTGFKRRRRLLTEIDMVSVL